MYSVSYSCSNCGHDFDKEFPTGREADRVVICPNCGCSTGERRLFDPGETTEQPWPFYPYLYYPYYYPSPEPQKLLWEPNYGYDFKTTGVGWLEVSPINI